MSNSRVPYTNFKAAIGTYILNKWPDSSNSFPNNKLNQIKPILREWYQNVRLSQKEEITHLKIRISLTDITDSFLHKNEYHHEWKFTKLFA